MTYCYCIAYCQYNNNKAKAIFLVYYRCTCKSRQMQYFLVWLITWRTRRVLHHCMAATWCCHWNILHRPHLGNSIEKMVPPSQGFLNTAVVSERFKNDKGGLMDVAGNNNQQSADLLSTDTFHVDNDFLMQDRIPSMQQACSAKTILL